MFFCSSIAKCFVVFCVVLLCRYYYIRGLHIKNPYALKPVYEGTERKKIYIVLGGVALLQMPLMFLACYLGMTYIYVFTWVIFCHIVCFVYYKLAAKGRLKYLYTFPAECILFPFFMCSLPWHMVYSFFDAFPFYYKLMSSDVFARHFNAMVNFFTDFSTGRYLGASSYIFFISLCLGLALFRKSYLRTWSYIFYAVDRAEKGASTLVVGILMLLAIMAGFHVFTITTSDEMRMLLAFVYIFLPLLLMGVFAYEKYKLESNKEDTKA